MLSDEEITALSPGAAAASRLIKSGYTLTQIYREHLKAVEELEQQKLENRRLEEYFRELVHVSEKPDCFRLIFLLYGENIGLNRFLAIFDRILFRTSR